MVLKNNGKINFLLHVCHGFDKILTGGVIAMHYLAYLLAKEGHNVYIFCKPEYPHENIHSINCWITQNDSKKELGASRIGYKYDSFSYNHKNTVSIYPQTTWGNWFNTNHVARWLLYNPEKDIENTWGENDYYFSYGKQNQLINNIKEKECQELIAMNFNFDKFKNLNKNRSGFCHLFHKHTSPGAEEFLIEINSKSLGNWTLDNNKDELFKLNEEFNKYEYFICYDQLSFWPQIAALCGCKVIVMNVKNNPNAYYDYNTTSKEYRLQNPLKKYGVAFGFSDLSHAVNTQYLVEDHLTEMENYNLDTVKNFITFWENKCYG
tara:strand:+ start:414 stop:1376 length:963 start_codon:yes stop_codon:yes gene_type:complete